MPLDLASRVAFGLIAASPILLAQDPPPAPGGGAPATTQATTTQAPPTGQTPPTTQAPPAKGLEWQVGDYKLKLGGYVKVDVIHDFDKIGSLDSFDPRTIPTNDESNPGTNTRIHARQTRLNFDLRGPTPEGEIHTFVEGDFFGDGNAFRMRHAYGEFGGLLGGQTWSTFMDEDAMPETLDFESPIAFPQIRQGQVRFTEKFSDTFLGAIALEDPASKIVAPPVPGASEEAMPDVAARLRWTHGLGHTQLGLFGGMARYRPTAGSPDSVGLWGVNLSTKLATFDQDQTFVQVTYGDGVGRYRGGLTAGPDANGRLEAVTTFGAMLAYEHHWSDTWRSTATYSWGKGDAPAGVPATTTDKLQYLAANLIYQFSKRAWCGVEYLYGSNETVNDARGEANRIQFSVKYSF